MSTKVFKTIDEQVEILQQKGLVIDDIDTVKDILLRENYFFVNGYRHLFVKSTENRQFIDGTNFEEIYAMFYFDRQLRNIIFKNVLIVENNLKSILSYVVSKNRGYKEKSYLNPNNFVKNPKQSRQVSDLLRKMSRQIRTNGAQHSATAHYLANYDYIPLWVVVKVLSFGIVSELFTILKPEDQVEIATILEVNTDDVLDYLPILANYRNLCAHEDLCYEHRTQKYINDSRYHHLLDIPKMNGEYIYGKNDLFSVMIILKNLLAKDVFTMLINEISYELDRLSGRLRSINIDKVLDRMGFPKNYKELARL